MSLQKQINVCDTCNERISKLKCSMCEKDVCNNCYSTIEGETYSHYGHNHLIFKVLTPNLSVREAGAPSIILCKECTEKLDKIIDNLQKFILTKNGDDNSKRLKKELLLELSKIFTDYAKVATI